MICHSQYKYHTQSTINYVVELYKSGNDAQTISEHTGLGFWSVVEILNRVDDYDIEQANLLNELEHNQ